MWIARNKNGKLCLYNEKPIKLAQGFWKNIDKSFELDENLFPEITWDKGAVEVDIIPKSSGERNFYWRSVLEIPEFNRWIIFADTSEISGPKYISSIEKYNKELENFWDRCCYESELL